MAEVIIMPKLGFNMDEGELIQWCKKIGEPVKKGDVLFEINTDKTVMPVEATQDGVLLKTMLEENQFAPVFTPIAVVGQAGEDPDQALAEYQQKENRTAGGENAESAPESAPPASDTCAQGPSVGKLKLTPRARTYIRENDIDPESIAQIQGTGFDGGITARDIKASPLARRLSEKLGVDLVGVQGTGVGGKIMREDVAKAAAAVPSPASVSDSLQISASAPYKGVRKIIGDKLAHSKFTAPHLSAGSCPVWR